MSTVSQLIDVKYTDLTNYTTGANTDVLGLVLEHHWGPVGVLNTFAQSDFYQNYPESLPIGFSYVSPTRYYAYAQAKRALEYPNVVVEPYRIQGGWKYSEIVIAETVSGTTQYMVKQNAKQFADLSTSPCVISLKYPGIPPKSLIGDFDRLAILLSVSVATNIITIKVCGASEVATQPASGFYLQEDNKYFQVDSSSPIESFTGSFDPMAMQDGQSFFIKKVTEKSEFISVAVNSEKQVPADIVESAIHILSGVTIPEVPTQEQYEAAVDVFADTMNSEATLLISPVATANLDSKIATVAEERQDLNAVLGYPVDSPFLKTQIKTFLTTMAGIRNMFSVLVVGREVSKVMGYDITLNCVGGFCGATINIAKTVRTNQLASAFTYGGYRGALLETLSFDDVAELHKLGIISVFSSNQGPMIFGIRTLHVRQTSYFAQFNVMRVLTKILRQVFPECLNAIHTDAAANPITRSNFNVRFNNIINDEIAQQNLAGDSYADCLGEINSDNNTKGGRIFNLVLALHFIGLVESISIRVYATDSSVTAQIV